MTGGISSRNQETQRWGPKSFTAVRPSDGGPMLCRELKLLALALTTSFADQP